MTNRAVIWLAISVAAFALASCESVSEKEDPLAASVIDEADLNYLMLTAGNPNDAATYFQQSLDREPERADFRRGLAISLSRAKRYLEAARVFQQLKTLDQDTPLDRLEYAFVVIKLDRWDDVGVLAQSLPDGLLTPRRHLLDAMVADQNNDWAAADAAYSRAEKLALRPASVLNNWGVSQMSRGDLANAEKKFESAISFDTSMFSAKNNLVITRGLQGKYNLPIIPMTEEERAIVLNNLGIIALRRGDDRIARGLFAAAVDIHPQYYSAAVDRLAALEATVEN